MSAAQMAHWLKSIGKGSEWAGIRLVFNSGRLVGAGQAVVLIGAGYITYRLGKWGYEKLIDYLQERQHVIVTGEVV